jgi:hypothetical protein
VHERKQNCQTSTLGETGKLGEEKTPVVSDVCACVQVDTQERFVFVWAKKAQVELEVDVGGGWWNGCDRVRIVPRMVLFRVSCGGCRCGVCEQQRKLHEDEETGHTKFIKSRMETADMVGGILRCQD